VGKDVEPLKSLPAFFDAEGLSVAQHFTTSDDGTRVPYFVVGPQADGPLPTVLYGYGGFENSLLPTYMPVTGRGWLERGGVFVVANIRGGGEYGPRWHRAALKENRFRAYEDFAAVARDLIDRGVTTADRLGIVGGSNGGLLVGNMLTRYPDLFAAVVCQVPLLDMQRYHKLSAGASWIAEYGDPDVPEEWAYLQTFSPYHNVRADAEYPPVLFTTSTRDDRVHPGHARKMAALMTDQGHDVLYYENVEGGHAGAADNAQRAYVSALEFSFLADVLFEGAPRPPARTRP
jgi:prolyl oligopeptidase